MSLRFLCLFYAVCTYIQATSWAATHDELPQCGITGVYKTRQTLLQSPNYPDSYEPSTCLDYVIRSPYRCPTKFHIQFLDFLLESSKNCTNDYLAVGLENDGDDMDVLCGQVVGIKKYHTPDGVLRLRFFSDDSPWTTAKGFKILITRLACEREELLRSNIDPTEDDTEQVNAPATQLLAPHNTLPELFRNLSLHDQHIPYPLAPLFGLNYPNPIPNYPSPPPPTAFGGIYVPITSQQQLSQQTLFPVNQAEANKEKPCTPTQTQLQQLPQFYLRSGQALQKQELPLIPDQYKSWQNQAVDNKPSTENALTRQQINSPLYSQPAEPCCASAFNQKRFYLSSPGFPRTAFTSLLPTQQRDCQFQLEKTSQSVCRLRVEFKFFDFGQTYSGTGAKQGNIEVAIGTSKDVCTEDFIQIDDERFCGCRTGYVYNSFWGLGKKSIRMRIGYSGIPSSGFLLDIFQEDCTGLQYVPGHLPGAQNLLPTQPTALTGTQNVGLVQSNNLVGQQSNGFTNLGQQQNTLNLLGFNGQQSAAVGNQQQAAFLPQQIYPFYQQTAQQYNPQNSPFWMPPQQQLPLAYPMPQFRATRNLDFAKSETSHQPLTVVETNSTRKEYYYFDGDETFSRARISDEPDDPDKMVNTQFAALRGRCTFDAMDILRLSVDYNWITKPTCYSPQGRWFSNLFG